MTENLYYGAHLSISKGIKKADIPNRYMNNGYTIWLLFEKDGNI